MKKNNYLQQIIVLPILFSIFIAIFVLVFSKYNFQNEFKSHMDKHLIESIENEKQLSKLKIRNAFKYIAHINKIFPNDIDKQKKFITQYLKDQTDKKQYLFIYSDVNLKGGNQFAKMYINPNRPDLIGKYLNDNYKDLKGKEFRKLMLQDIKRKGDAYITYHYKKPDTNIDLEKTSYFKYYPKLKWIIATGTYIDDARLDIDKELEAELNRIDKKFFNVAFLLAMFIVLYSVFIYFKMKKVRTEIENKDKRISHHKYILDVIVDIQQELISNTEFNSSVEYILKEISRVLDVDRIYIFENNVIDGKIVCSQKFEYTKQNVSAQMNNAGLQNLPYDDFIPRWKDILSGNNIINGLVKDFPTIEKDILEAQNVKSLLVVPIFFENKWWGFVGLDDCTINRKWTELEQDVLNIISNSFITALMQDNYYKSLENRVKRQVKDIRKKDKMIVQQSKMASMGEMIGNIAHQWRQPLNVVSTLVISLQMKYDMGLLDNEFMERYITKTNDTLQNMSQTIDDFRNFFVPNKEKSKFDIEKTIQDSLKFVGGSFKTHSINLDIHSSQECMLFGYKNEFLQAILVILNNSKDAIIQNRIKNAIIAVKITCIEQIINITIQDNAGGIPKDILDKVCEPYFTTKHKSQGTGIGLYMVQEIIEKHMGGALLIENANNGTKITIILNNGDMDNG